MKSIGSKLTAIMLCVILIGIAVTLGINVAISGRAITNESLAKVQKSTLYEAERLDRWLSFQTAGVITLADMLQSMDSLADTLAADQSASTVSIEDQTTRTLRPLLKAVLDENEAYFEVYVGFLDGSAVSGSGYRFDYSWWVSYERGWYSLALTDPGRAHITSPYVDAQTGELCITAVRAIVNKGRLVGVLGADIFVTELQNITLGATIDSTGYSMLVDTNGDILIHPDPMFAPDAEGNFRNLATVANGGYAPVWAQAKTSNNVFKYSAPGTAAYYYDAVPLSSTGWYMVAALPARVVSQQINRSILVAIGVSVVILLIAALLIHMTVKTLISQPLIPFTAFMKRASSTGDFTETPEDTKLVAIFSQRGDEIGQCITAAVAFVGRIVAVSQALETVAADDLTVELAPLSERDFLGLSLRAMIAKLNSMFGDIRQATGQVSSGARQISNGAQTLAQGATEQAASIEELSGSIAEIADKTRDNAEKAETAANLANTIMGSAEKGSRQMDEMMEAVKEINQASQSISKVIKVIDDIAFQTNILALNAAVEAARAGQHGKGFAVVAEEVRNLASKSAEAAKETGIMIQNSMEKAELGAAIARETAESLEKIVDGISQSNQIVNEIANSSEEQSLGITQINIGIDQVSQVVQQNSATAEESAAASEEMNGQADLLAELIMQFKLKDEGNRPATRAQAQPQPQQFSMPMLADAQDDPEDFGYDGYDKY